MDSKRKYKKRSAWSTRDEKLLVELWSDHILQLRGARKNSHIYEEMRVKLEGYGCVVGAEEIRTKINNLTSRYRKEKSVVGISGGSPSNWPLYADIHALLGNLKINNLQCIREESINEDTIISQPSPPLSPGFSMDVEFLDESLMSQPSTSSGAHDTPSARQPKKSNTQAEVLKRMIALEENLQRQNEHLEEHDSQMYLLELRKTDLLEQFVSSSKELNNAFIEYLKKN